MAEGAGKVPTLEELIGNVQTYKKGSEAATQQVLSALNTQADITNDTAATYAQQATDDATVATAKNAADFATQLARVKAANALGTNLKSSTEIITTLAAKSADAFERKEAALNRVAEKESISFLSSPLAYIKAQYTINDDIAEHNIANAQQKNADQRIATINNLTQQTVITQNAISEPLTAASMEASARTAAVAATVAANNAQVAALSYGTKGIEFALNAKKEVLALSFQTLQAQKAEQSMSIALQNLELNKQEFEQRKKQYAEQDADKHQQQELAQSVVDTVNLGRKALLGPNSAPMDDISGKMVLATLKGKGTLSVEMQKYYDAGERTKLAGTIIIGATPAAAAETLQTVPVHLNPTQGAIKTLLSRAASDTSAALKTADMPGVQKNPVFIGMDKKDKNTLNAAMNGRAQQLLNEAAKIIKPGDYDNPYHIGSINQLAEHSPTVRALPVVQKVFAPLMKAGVQLTDPKQIVSLVGDAVAKGTISHKEALELTTVYHVGVAANAAMRNFTGFGLVPKLSYNAMIETNPDGFTSSELVDMTKPDAVSRALIKLQSKRLQQQLMNGEKSMTPGFNAIKLNNKPYQNMTDEERSRVVAPFFITDPK